MRILFGIPFLYPALAYGGAARAAYHLAEALQQQGHDVAVLTTDVWDAASRYRERDFRAPFEVVRLRNISNRAAYSLQFYSPRHAAASAERMLSGTDIVHLHTFRNLLNDVIARKAARRGVPFVLSGHGTIPRIERFRGLKRVYDALLGNWQLQHASGFVAVTNAEARGIANVLPPGRPLATIPNGIAEFDPPESGAFRKKWSINAEEKVVLYLGKITPRKGVQHLVRAYSQMTSEARLVIAGNDMGYGREIRKLAAELGLERQVVWTGLLQDSEKYQALRDADVTVYPSVHEVFGLVPLESLLCGTLVVVCGDDGCGEIIRETGGGEIVTWGDVQGLAAAIRLQLRSGKGRPDLAQAAAYVRGHFHWPTVAGAVTKFYEEVLQSSRNRTSVSQPEAAARLARGATQPARESTISRIALKFAPYGSRRWRVLTAISRTVLHGEPFRFGHLGVDDVLHRVTPRPVRRLLHGSNTAGRVALWMRRTAARVRGLGGTKGGNVQEQLANARDAMRAGQWQSAERLWNDCLKKDPFCIDAYRCIAWLQTARGDYFQAAHTLAAALAAKPGSIELETQLASIYFASGSFWEAEKILNLSLKRTPDHLEAFLLLADLRMMDGRPEDAAHLYRKVLDLDPGHASAKAALAECTPASAESPKVSVIIPVWNELEHTRRCLESIRGAYSNLEVLVVDNGSQEQTAAFLRSQSHWIRTLRNETNLGFVRACNQGAAAADGVYLLFLNNDAVVKAGAIAALARTAESDPAIGAAGAKLLYPSGVLQEAGGIVFRDGSAWNYGKGDDPDRPAYNYLRDAAYCSAACLLVRKETFLRIGGFDERYSPGYFEDTDLAFALRKAGCRVVLQPEAEVIHIEGATAGTDIKAGFKRFQAINQEKFREKWSAELSAQPAFGACTVRNASNQGAGRRILFIDHYLPLYDRSSGEHRTFQILKLLKQEGHDITFIARNGEYQRRYKHALQQLGIETYATDPLRMISWDYEPHARKIGFADLLRERRFSLAILSRYQIAQTYMPILNKHAADLPVLVDTIDLHFVRETRKADLYSGRDRATADQIKLAEMAVYRQSQGVITVTAEERSILQGELGPDKPVFVIPNIHPIPETTTPFRERRDLLFTGNFSHPPNSDAAMYLCNEILPRIRKAIPEVRLFVAGAHSLLFAGELRQDGVTVTGYVPSLAPFLRSCRVSVAPLRYGAGMKGKIGETLSYGLPAVTTAVGAEGMDLIPGEHVLVAEDAQQFAEAVCKLYMDEALWNRLSEQGRHVIEARYSPGRILPDIRSLVESMSHENLPAR